MGSKCRHDVVYYGVVNLKDRGEQVGSIDVWKCRACGDIFCEDKHWGITELATEIGFPKLDKNEQWAVIGCRANNELKWELLKAKPGSILDHDCPTHTRLEVDQDLKLKGEPAGVHTLILVKDNIAADVEL